MSDCSTLMLLLSRIIIVFIWPDSLCLSPPDNTPLRSSLVAEANTVELFREPEEELGFRIVGGKDTPLGNIVIQEIVRDSLAARDGRLAPGDHILEVCGTLSEGVCWDNLAHNVKYSPPLHVNLKVFRCHCVTVHLSILCINSLSVPSHWYCKQSFWGGRGKVDFQDKQVLAPWQWGVVSAAGNKRHVGVNSLT